MSASIVMYKFSIHHSWSQVSVITCGIEDYDQTVSEIHKRWPERRKVNVWTLHKTPLCEGQWATYEDFKI